MRFIWKLLKALVGLALCIIAGTLVAALVLMGVCAFGQMAKMLLVNISATAWWITGAMAFATFVWWLFTDGVRWGFEAQKALFRRESKPGRGESRPSGQTYVDEGL